MKEKLNKKEQHNLYTLYTIYRSNIVGKTNQLVELLMVLLVNPTLQSTGEHVIFMAY